MYKGMEAPNHNDVDEQPLRQIILLLQNNKPHPLPLPLTYQLKLHLPVTIPLLLFQ